MNYTYMKFPGFKSKALTLSYDDGTVHDIKLVEIMKKYGIKGTFNINSGMFGDNNANGRLTLEECKELYIPAGMEVAVHGYQHLSLAELDDSLKVMDVIRDRENLENMFGTVITGMAYANGSFDDRTVEVLKMCGIEYSRTCKATMDFKVPEDWLRLPPTCHHVVPNLMELAEKFVEGKDRAYYWSKNPRLFYLWGHSYEFANNDNWNVIEDFCKYMGGREDIWYATNIEIYRYVMAFRSLKFSAGATFVYNPSSIPVYLGYHENELLVNPGETIEIYK